MPAIQWTNPPTGHLVAHKALATQVSLEVGGVAEHLDAVAQGLTLLDNGQFWRTASTLAPRRDVAPEALMLTATAEYKINYRPAGRLSLQVIGQHHISQPYVGLVFFISDAPERLPLPWQESRSEENAALTLLAVGDQLRLANGYPRPQDESPTRIWHWWQPSCGWMRGATVTYGGWSVRLG